MTSPLSSPLRGGNRALSPFRGEAERGKFSQVEGSTHAHPKLKGNLGLLSDRLVVIASESEAIWLSKESTNSKGFPRHPDLSGLLGMTANSF